MRARLAHLGTAAAGCRGCRRGRIAGVDTLMRWLARGGDHGAWSLGWGEARVARLWMARGIGCEEGARPHRGPGIQRAHRRRGWQPSDLQEQWWARQGLNLRLLPCQQTGGKRCADRRFPRSPPTVDAEVMRSLGDSFFRRSVPMVSATASVARSMQVRGWGLGPRLGRGPVRGRAGMQRRGSRRPARCLGDNCPYSAQTAPVGSGQLRLGWHSVESGLVGCSRAWWNDRENDHQSKQ
jgi:hypothetical protein